MTLAKLALVKKAMLQTWMCVCMVICNHYVLPCCFLFVWNSVLVRMSLIQTEDGHHSTRWSSLGWRNIMHNLLLFKSGNEVNWCLDCFHVWLGRSKTMHTVWRTSTFKIHIGYILRRKWKTSIDSSNWINTRQEITKHGMAKFSDSQWQWPRSQAWTGGRTDIPTLQIVSYVADTAVFMSLHKPALTLTAFMSLATVC